MKIENLGIEDALNRLVEAHPSEPVQIYVETYFGKTRCTASIGELSIGEDSIPKSYGFADTAADATDRALEAGKDRRTPEARKQLKIESLRAELAKLEVEKVKWVTAAS